MSNLKVDEGAGPKDVFSRIFREKHIFLKKSIPLGSAYL